MIILLKHTPHMKKYKSVASVHPRIEQASPSVTFGRAVNSVTFGRAVYFADVECRRLLGPCPHLPPLPLQPPHPLLSPLCPHGQLPQESLLRSVIKLFKL